LPKRICSLFMCLYILYFQSHPDYPIILAGNRDEFYDRKALPVHCWTDYPEIAGGKDLKEGGSWLAVNNSGKFAVVTNYRDPASIKDTAVSRGTLVSNFLIRKLGCEEYLNQIAENDGDYNGYNLIAGTHEEVYYYSNKIHQYSKLAKGVYMLSNHFLDTPWFKALRAREMCSEILSRGKEIDADALFSVFADQFTAPDDQLPDTGVGYNLEKMLSSIYIESKVYGTVATTILTMDKSGYVTIHEKTFNPPGRNVIRFIRQ
jgi:uncharacterized protein with NRDE domain